MPYTLQDVWDEALVLVGWDPDDGYLSPAVVRRTLVSKAQRDVAAELDWPELTVESTLTYTGDPPYELPGSENFLRLKWVFVDGDSEPLRPKQRTELLRYEGNPAGQPSWFAVGGNGLGGLQLWLSSKPREGLTIRYGYVRKPENLANPTDPLLVPDHLMEAVIARTMYYMALRKGDTDRAGVLLSDYESTLDDLRDEAIVQRGPAVPSTRDDW